MPCVISPLFSTKVMNFYFSLIMERGSGEGGQLKVYSFSTFFFPKLRAGGHAALKRWTKAVDLFSFDLILVPLHLGVHWAMAVSHSCTPFLDTQCLKVPVILQIGLDFNLYFFGYRQNPNVIHCGLMLRSRSRHCTF